MYYVLVYGNDNCDFCRATCELINFLITKGYTFDLQYERLTRQLKEQIMNHYNVNVTTIPQIIVDQEYIGGYTKFVNWCNKEFPFIIEEWNKHKQEEWFITEFNDMSF